VPHAPSDLLRCFGGADGVCSTVLVFGWRAASALEWVKAGIGLVTTRLLGRAPPGGKSGRCSGGHHADAKAVSGWLMGS
jgi:hypothetical protein